MATGDVAKITLVCVNDSVGIVNTFHYMDRSGGSTVIDAATAANDFWTNNSAVFISAMTQNTQFLSVQYDCIAGPGTLNTGIYNIPAATYGTIILQQMPQEICAALFRNTGKTGRAQRGRLFWGPLSIDAFASSDPSDGKIDTTDSALLGIAAIIKGTFTTQTVGLSPVLVNKTKTPTATNIINSGISPICVHRRSRRLRDPN